MNVKLITSIIQAGLLMTTEAMIADKPKKGTSSVPAMPSEDLYYLQSSDVIRFVTILSEVRYMEGYS